MGKTFASEDQRKDKLFEGWIHFLGKTHIDLESEYGEVTHFERFFEGDVVVQSVSKNKFDLVLGTGERIRNIHVPPEIARHTSSNDHMYLEMGMLKNRWRILHVVTIGSTIGNHGIHVTVNPLLMEKPSSNQTLH